MTLPIAILRTGTVSPVGFNSPSTFAALQVRLNNFEETAYFGRDGEAIVASAIPSSFGSATASALDRHIAFLSGAIAECLAGVDGGQPPGLPILLCVAEITRAGRLPDLDIALRDGVERQLGIRFGPESKVFAYGQASAFFALNDAFSLLDDHPLVLIAGVDSYIIPATLTSLINNKRVLNAENPSGFIPGEAACALLLGRPAMLERVCALFSSDPAKRQVPSVTMPALYCTSVAVARERAVLGGGAPNRAEALSEAIKVAAKGLPDQAESICLRISAQSNEDFYAKEFAIAAGRTKMSQSPLWMVCDSLGETGAAAGLLTLAWAYTSGHRGLLPGSEVVCLAASDEGERAAAVVSYGHYQPEKKEGKRWPFL